LFCLQEDINAWRPGPKKRQPAFKREDIPRASNASEKAETWSSSVSTSSTPLKSESLDLVSSIWSANVTFFFFVSTRILALAFVFAFLARFGLVTVGSTESAAVEGVSDDDDTEVLPSVFCFFNLRGGESSLAESFKSSSKSSTVSSSRSESPSTSL
jgi:hypothetical protein